MISQISIFTSTSISKFENFGILASISFILFSEMKALIGCEDKSFHTKVASNITRFRVKNQTCNVSKLSSASWYNHIKCTKD